MGQNQSRHIRVTAGAEDFHPAVWSEEGGLGEELHPQDCGEVELGRGGRECFLDSWISNGNKVEGC